MRGGARSTEGPGALSRAPHKLIATPYIQASHGRPGQRRGPPPVAPNLLPFPMLLRGAGLAQAGLPNRPACGGQQAPLHAQQQRRRRRRQLAPRAEGAAEPPPPPPPPPRPPWWLPGGQQQQQQQHGARLPPAARWLAAALLPAAALLAAGQGRPAPAHAASSGPWHMPAPAAAAAPASSAAGGGSSARQHPPVVAASVSIGGTSPTFRPERPADIAAFKLAGLLQQVLSANIFVKASHGGCLGLGVCWLGCVRWLPHRQAG